MMAHIDQQSHEYNDVDHEVDNNFNIHEEQDSVSIGSNSSDLSHGSVTRKLSKIEKKI